MYKYIQLFSPILYKYTTIIAEHMMRVRDGACVRSVGLVCRMKIARKLMKTTYTVIIFFQNRNRNQQTKLTQIGANIKRYLSEYKNPENLTFEINKKI